MSANDDDRTRPVMTTRTALILTISLLAGAGTGALLQLSDRHHAAEAVIAAITVFIASIKLMHQWIAPDRPDQDGKPEPRESPRADRTTRTGPG